MTRGFQINGETLVRVKGNGALALSGASVAGLLSELGLAADKISILPRFYHEDMHVDDFGPNVPADVMYQLAEVTIRMLLIHYDTAVLNACLSESMGGAPFGMMSPAGAPLGAGKPLFASGNHYISLNLLSPVLGQPWRFPACYLSQQPAEIPLGTDVTAVSLIWRAIPYQTPLMSGMTASGSVVATTNIGVASSGATLWDRTLDL